MNRRRILAAVGGHRIPYDEVEYLESTGTQWIDTGIDIGTGVLGFFMDFKITNVEHDKWVGYNYYSDGDRAIQFGLYLGNFLFMSAMYDHSLQIAYEQRADTFRHNIFFNHINGFSIDGIVKVENTVEREIDQHGSFWLFARNGSITSSNYSAIKMQLFSFKAWKDGVIFKDLVPVRFTNESGLNEGALYDLVGKQLLRNQGYGTFVIGPDKA